MRGVASGPVLGAILVALTLSIIWAANAPIDDPYSTLNMGWNGTSELAERGFLAVRADLAGALSTGAIDLLLIEGPSRQFTRVEADSIGNFVREGGLLVIADNFGSANGLLDLMGVPVRFDHRLLVDPLFYRKQPTFPVVSALAPSEFTTGVDELLLDYATVLNITARDKVRLLASSSPYSFLDSNRDGVKNPEEPSGAFPVMAEVPLGQGAIVLLTSPASLANGLIHEAKNSVLVENILNTATARYGSQAEHAAILDQTHLEASPFASAELGARQLVTWVLEGGMPLSEQLGLTGLVMVLVAARYVYKSPSKETAKTEGSYIRNSLDVESVLRLHPTWDRARLEHVARELEVSLNWRQFREGE